MGLAGSVYDANSIDAVLGFPPVGSPVAGGTLLSAVVDGAICAQNITRALYDEALHQQPPRLEANVFGLVIPPSSLAPGCGSPGAEITLCVGEKATDARVTGSWPRAYAYLPDEPSSSDMLLWQANQIVRFLAIPTDEACPAPVSLPITGRQDGSLPIPRELIAGALLQITGAALLLSGQTRKSDLRPH